jgi:hypothetical protein
MSDEQMKSLLVAVACGIASVVVVEAIHPFWVAFLLALGAVTLFCTAERIWRKRASR